MARLRKKLRSSRQHGTALVEFALVLPILLVITLAALDLGRAFLVKNVLHQAAREGVRMRAVKHDPATSDDMLEIEDRVKQVAGAAGLTARDVQISQIAVAKQDSVSVSTQFHFTFPGIFRLVGMNVDSLTLTATCYMQQEGS